MRNRLLCGLLAALFLGVAGASCSRTINAGTASRAVLDAPAERPGFTIAILGDRTNGEPEGLQVLRQAVEDINRLRPGLVLHIGDMVPGYKRYMAEWEEDIGAFKGVIGGLEAPFYPCAGNHDVITGTGDPDDHRGEDLHKKHFGPLYYSFDYRDCHFVVLYSDEALQSLPRFSARQLDWLARDLEGSRGRQSFVFVHKPAWEYPKSNWDEVHAILKRHDVRAVFAGHFHHSHKSIERDGIPHYVMGVTGGRTYSPEGAGGLEHFSLLHIRPDSFTLAHLRPGSVLPEDFVTHADFKNMETIRFLGRDKVGVLAAIPSPEMGEVDESVRAIVHNPLDRPLTVTVRGNPRGGPWTFEPPEGSSLRVDAGQSVETSITARCPRIRPAELVVPEIEVQYDYANERGETVPLVLRRRLPLVRRGKLPVPREAGSDDEAILATPGRTRGIWNVAAWHFSPYESREPSARFRPMTSREAFWFRVRVPDVAIAHHRARPGGRLLSDAIFVGLLPMGAAEEVSTPPRVIVLFPFAPAGEGGAFLADFDDRAPKLLDVIAGVKHFAEKTDDGWQCTAEIPWEVLVGKKLPLGERLRFNFGVWDNDGRLFTELRTWAPYDDVSRWGTIVLEEAR